MKKLLFILITIPLIFGSCEKEDDSPNSGSNNTSGTIIGTWELEDYTGTSTQGYIDPVLLTETVLETETNTMSTNPINLFWVYRDNGTFSEYQFNNDTISSYQHYDYVKNGDEVSITFEGDDIMTWTVTSLTSNNLNVSIENLTLSSSANKRSIIICILLLSLSFTMTIFLTLTLFSCADMFAAMLRFKSSAANSS